MVKGAINLTAWWEGRTFQEKSNMMGDREDESYSMGQDQAYDEEWDGMTIKEKREFYKDWN